MQSFSYFWIMRSLNSVQNLIETVSFHSTSTKIYLFSLKIAIILILFLFFHSNLLTWLSKWLLTNLLLLLKLSKQLVSHSMLSEINMILCLLSLFSKLKASDSELSNSKSLMLSISVPVLYLCCQILRIQPSSKKYLIWSLQTQSFMNERIWCWSNLNTTALIRSLSALTVLLSL